VKAAPTADVTQILSKIERGDPDAAERLLPLLYDELRKLAGQKLGCEKPGLTLQATALVHEAYVRLVDVEQAQHWNSCGHFLLLQPKQCGEYLLRMLGGGPERSTAGTVFGRSWNPPSSLPRK
jgi:hypothetical protein